MYHHRLKLRILLHLFPVKRIIQEPRAEYAPLKDYEYVNGNFYNDSKLVYKRLKADFVSGEFSRMPEGSTLKKLDDYYRQWQNEDEREKLAMDKIREMMDHNLQSVLGNVSHLTKRKRECYTLFVQK